MEAPGLEFTPPPEGKPYLGDLEVVSGLVNHFAYRVLEIESAFRAGKPGYENAQQRIEAMAAKAGAAIMGNDPEFSVAPWQNRDRLGTVLRLTTPGIQYLDDPGVKFFEWMALGLVKIARAMEQGMPDEAAGPKVRVLLDDAIQKIIGIKGIPGESRG